MTRRKYKLIFLLAFIMLGVSIPGLRGIKAEEADTATLRIIATGDLHGRVTAYDCETNSNTPENGLSKLATLVKQKKSEIGSENALLLDAGDFLYDYTSNYIYDNHKDLVQPIMKAMSLMGYDYITLGNHEFDYPYEYLTRQLKASGLSDKVLVSNTIWHDNGKQVYHPSAIITKALSTESGDTVDVKVGIVGSTTNSISTRRGDYVNYIDAVNSYDSIVAEANRLKLVEKVDLVLVILHGGIGTKTLDKTSENIGYALTKVDSIDTVLTGHTHEVFPDSKYPIAGINNVDYETGRINGKPVLATLYHARALGTIDLNLKITSDGTVTIADGYAMIDYVTKSTKEDSSITDMFQDYMEIIKEGSDTISYKIKKGITYHNYDTVLRDSNLYQLLNNAKIDYGMTYISEYIPEYENLPVIACTRNLLNLNEAYINIKDSFTGEKISRIISESSAARPSGYIQMYEISGKNLKEWLEYNASIYATEGTTLKNLLQKYVSKNKKVSTLLQEDYIYNWNRYYIFDGISYTIDLSKKARYKADGSLISASNYRIKDVYYNGIKVKDSLKFVVVTDSGIPSLSFLPKEGVDSIKDSRDYETSKNVTLEYIKKQSKLGDISVIADNNWSLTAGKNYSFLLGVPKTIVSTVSKYTWNDSLAAETTSYSFLKGNLPVNTQTINIVAAQGRTEINNNPVTVNISASSRNMVEEIRYLSGKITDNSDVKWKTAEIVKNYAFHANKNGVYTIRAKDSKGKTSLAYVTVDRYDNNILPSPKLDRLTNRNTTFTGTATPSATIHVSIGDDTYKALVADNGKFSITIQPPKAFVSITAYVEISNKKSTTVIANVRKTGPNAVQLNKITVGDTIVTGTTDADTLVYALIWKTIYVGKGQTQVYKNSEFYNSTYNIVETDITIHPLTGEYRINLPFLKTNMKVFVFSVDRFGITGKSTMLVPVY